MNDIIDCHYSIHIGTMQIRGVCHISPMLLASIEEHRKQYKSAFGSGWFEAKQERALDSLNGVAQQGPIEEEIIMLECDYEGRVFGMAITLERIGMKSAVFEVL